MTDTKELRRLLAEATPGDWTKESAVAVSCPDRRPICFLDVPRVQRECEANAALIVALRNAAPELLDRLERAEVALKTIREECFDDSEWAQIIDKALTASEETP